MTALLIRRVFARLGMVALTFLLLMDIANAQAVRYQYDETGRLRRVTYPNQMQRVYRIDGAGNRVDVTDSVIPPPSTPTGLSAALFTPAQVNLSWNASTDNSGAGIAGYKIYRNDTLLVVTTTSATTYSDRAVAGGNSYEYKVSAYDGFDVESDRSSPANVSVPRIMLSNPIVVTTVHAGTSTAHFELTSSGDIRVSQSNSDTVIDNGDWMTPKVGLTGMRAMVSVRAGFGCSGAPREQWVDLSLSPVWTVTASGGNNTTSRCEATLRVAHATEPGVGVMVDLILVAVSQTAPDTTPPSVPGSFSATPVAATRVNLSWTASTDTGGSNLSGYRVYRDGALLATLPTTATSYSDTTTTGSTTYNYAVAAFDGAGNAAQTTPIAVTTLVPITVTVGDRAITTVHPGSVVAAYTLSSAGDLQTSQSASSTVINVGTWVSPASQISRLDAYASPINGPGVTCNGSPTLSGFSLASGASWRAMASGGNSATQRCEFNLTISERATGAILGSGHIVVVAVSTNPPDTTAPSVPTGVAATASGQNQVTLTWNASTDTGGSGLAGYRIYRGGSLLNSTTSTSYLDTTVSAGTSYSYTVSAYDVATNESTRSTPAATVTTLPPPDTTPPSVPGSFSATSIAATRVNLSWTASTDTGGSNLSGYRVYRDGALLATLPTTATSYSDTTTAGSTTYNYAVAAFDGAGNAAQTTPIAVTTLASITVTVGNRAITTVHPGSVVAVYRLSSTGDLQASQSASSTVINVGTWVSPASQISRLDAYASPTNGPGVTCNGSPTLSGFSLASGASWTAMASGGNNTTQRCEFDLTISERATGAILGSGHIVVVAVSTNPPDTTPPSAPTNVRASAPNHAQVNVSWDPSTDTGGSGLAGYRVYRNGGLLTSTSSTSYSDTSVSPSTSYSYTVEAYDGVGNAAQSSAAGVTTPAAPDTSAPSAPTGLGASAISSSRIDLSWGGSSDSGGSGLAGYIIYRNGSQLTTTTATSYSDTSLAASTTYSYTVAAYDNAGNVSGQSNTASATTSAPAISITLFPLSVHTQQMGGTTATYTLTSAGDVLASQERSPAQVDVGDWLSPKSNMGDFDAMATQTSAAGTCTQGTYGAWLNLGTSRSWATSWSGGNIGSARNCQFSLSIRRASDGVVLGTVAIQVIAINAP